MAIATAAPSPLLQTVTTTPTEFWNDSCAAAELEHAISDGATGATSNPVLVLDALRLEPEPWEQRIREVAAARRPRATPTSRGGSPRRWRSAGRIARAGLRAHRGPTGAPLDPGRPRSLPRHRGDAGAGDRFHQLAPNIQVKLPVTVAGLAAIEEATASGIPINATVNTTVAGALAVARPSSADWSAVRHPAWTSTPSIPSAH